MKVKYFDLENKRVFITGGGSGIGASIVESFCEQGSDVFFVDINKKDSQKLLSYLKKKNVKIPTFIECNLLNIKKLQKIIKKIISKNGSIDILINNAANDDRHSTDQVDEKYWNNRMDVNLKHFFFTIKSVLGGMINNNKGSIVLFSTVAAQRGFTNHSIIASVKGAIEGLTVSLAAEFAPNIKVNCIAPSLTNSKIAEPILKNKIVAEGIAKAHPLKRIGEGKDTAAMAKFLLTEESSWITGQIIGVDGGRSTLA